MPPDRQLDFHQAERSPRVGFFCWSLGVLDMTVSEAIKDAVRTSTVSRYKLVQMSGGRLTEAELCSWLKGRQQLGPAKLDAVADLLSLKVVRARKRGA